MNYLQGRVFGRGADLIF